MGVPFLNFASFLKLPILCSGSRVSVLRFVARVALLPVFALVLATSALVSCSHSSSNQTSSSRVSDSQSPTTQTSEIQTESSDRQSNTAPPESQQDGGSPQTQTQPQPQTQQDNSWQAEWHFGYGTELEEHVHEGIQTSDGGYIAIGDKAESEVGIHSDILVIKIDGNGKLEWIKIFGTLQKPDTGYSVIETQSGYVLGVGLFDEKTQHAALIGLDKMGQEAWRQILHREQSERTNGAIRSVIQLPNGDLVAGGYTASFESGFLFIAEGKSFLARTNEGVASNSQTGLSWQMEIPNIPQVTKTKMEDTKTLAVLSTFVNPANEESNVSITRINLADQKIISHFTYGGANNLQAFDFDITFRASDVATNQPDGLARQPDGFIVAGHTTGYGVTNWDFALFRVSKTGEMLWLKTFGQPRGYDARYIHDEAYGVRQFENGNFIIAGGSGDEYEEYSDNTHSAGSSDEWKAYAVITDKNGETLAELIYDWGGNFVRGGNNAAEYVSLTKDGGFILFNDSDSQDPNSDSSSFGFLKVMP